MPDNTTSREEKRLKKEAAVRAILEGDRSVREVAEEWDVSRQAVDAWVQRFKRQGDLKPMKRGRKKLRPLTELDKRRFFEKVKSAYAERGYSLGDKVPRKDRLTEEDYGRMLTEITDQNCSGAFGRRTVRDMGIPLYYEPIPGLPEDFEFIDDDLYLRDPFDPEYQKQRELRSFDSDEEMEGELSPSEETAREQVEEDDDDLHFPKTQEDYEKWVAETKSMLKTRGYDPEKVYGAPQATGAGVRTGKHAKSTSRRKKKRRKNKPKRRR